MKSPGILPGLFLFKAKINAGDYKNEKSNKSSNTRY
ncbi:hypothetical protein ABIB30_003543 [Pedobacter sp. UYP1]